mgnify:FL=1
MMMRSRFDRDLETLNEELINMGNIIEKAIEAALTALMDQDLEMAQRIVEGDREVDEEEKSIERKCLRLLLQQQPVAGDLRMISSALKMVTDMERIGDHAADISEITIRLVEEDYIKTVEHIPQMAAAAIKMTQGSIEAFVKKDLEKVLSVIQYDDIVDDLFNVVKEEVIQLIKNDKDRAEQAIDFLLIAKYFERIGDHAQNIAEWVYFSLVGEHYTGYK